MTTDLPKVIDRFNGALQAYADIAGRAPSATLAKKGRQLSFLIAEKARALAPEKGEVRTERLAALKQGRGVKVRDSIKQSASIAKKNRVAEVRQFKKNGTLNKSRSGSFFAKGKARFRDGRVVQTLSKTVRRKGQELNLQALRVQRELNLRERGRGFTSAGSRIKSIAQLEKVAYSWRGHKTVDSHGRFNQLLATAGLELAQDGSSLLLRYAPQGKGPQSELGDSLSTPAGQRILAEALQEATSDMADYIAEIQAYEAAKVFGAAFPTTVSA